MTNREFYNAIISNAITEEVIAHAQNSLVKLDERNAKRANTPSKTALANEPIKAKIVEVLTNEPQTASEIASKVEISTQKASALCRQLVADEVLTVEEVKVPKKGKQKGYAVA